MFSPATVSIASRSVVVYDEHSGMRAARAFWFLEYFGHPNVRVLDGGYGSWTREGFPVTREAGPPPKSEWTGQRVAHTIATWRDVKSALGSDTVILDTRSDEEYLRHECAREAWGRRTWCRAHRVDAEPDPRRRVQASVRPSLDVRRSRRHAGPGGHHVLSGWLPRCARLPGAAAARLPASADLCGLLERMGRSRRFTSRDSES